MRRGMLLVELVLAIAVAMIALLAFAQVANRSVKNLGFTARRTAAAGYAAQGMEWIRSERSSLGWSGLYAKAGSVYCLSSLAWIAMSGTCGEMLGAAGFTRTATVTVKSATVPQRLTATVTVSWVESGKSYSSVLATEFTNY